MRYRKKPVEIEAIQVSWDAWSEICDFLNIPENGHGDEDALRADPDRLSIVIHTLEGDMRAELGDWIIKGVQGEFYPCKPDIFEATYEAVGDRPKPLYGLWRVDDDLAKTGWLTTHGGRVIVSEDPDELAQYSRYEVRELPPVISHAEWISDADTTTPARRPVIRSGPEHYGEGVRLLAAAADRQDDGRRLFGEQRPSDSATEILTGRARAHLLAALVASHAAAEHPDSIAWRQALGEEQS